MAQSVIHEVRVYPDRESMSRAAAVRLVDLVMRRVEKSDHFSLALSGGTTPLVLYKMLAGEFAEEIPWHKVHLYWGDERYVPQDDLRSNFRLVHDTVLDCVQIPLDNVHPMPTHRTSPDDAASDYEALLKTRFTGRWPRFDTVLLGLGTDGHTASLFPGSPVLDEAERWVAGVEVDVEPPARLTLTLPVLNAASNVSFLVSGREKAEILERVLTGPVDAIDCPASAVRPVKGTLVSFVDDAAASLLGDASPQGIRLVRSS